MGCMASLCAVYLLMMLKLDFRLREASVSAVCLLLLLLVKLGMGFHADWQDQARSATLRDARRDRIGKMPLEAVSAADVDADRHGCPVCLEAFVVGEMRMTLPCFHTFHEACVAQWLQEQDACPTCRHDVWTNSFNAGD